MAQTFVQDDPIFRQQFAIRRGKLLAGIDLQQTSGVEIGALCRPFIRREDGPILYVDYTDTASLRERYANDCGVDVNRIVEVDAIWGQNTLFEAVKGRYVDYVAASHVIEHVPDLITWLREIATILKSTGEVRLIIPDKRYTFDYFRRETSLSDVLLSYIVKARVPQPHSLLDYCLNAADVDVATAWQRDIRPDEGRPHHTVEGGIYLAQDVIKNGTYHDVHCWAFTPQSFARLCGQLARSGFIDFACEGFYDTEHNESEFFVRLRRSNNIEYTLQSWQNMQDAVTSPTPETWLERLKRKLTHTAPANAHNAKNTHKAPAALRTMSTSRIPNMPSEFDPEVPVALPEDFSPAAYLEANPDVRAAGVDPVEHYRKYGWLEGRRVKPAPPETAEIRDELMASSSTTS
jgi:Methyltransferase domain